MVAAKPHNVTFVMSDPLPRFTPEMVTGYPPVTEPQFGVTPPDGADRSAPHFAMYQVLVLVLNSLSCQAVLKKPDT